MYHQRSQFEGGSQAVLCACSSFWARLAARTPPTFSLTVEQLLCDFVHEEQCCPLFLQVHASKCAVENLLYKVTADGSAHISL